MEKILRYRSLEAFCRQRARISGESSPVWLEKANILANLAAAESRLKASAVDEDKTIMAPDKRARESAVP